MVKYFCRRRTCVDQRTSKADGAAQWSTIRDSANPNGDIEIVCIGLRPGEKLYEELLIDAESEPTSHPLIFRAHEKHFNRNNFGLNLMSWD